MKLVQFRTSDCPIRIGQDEKDTVVDAVEFDRPSLRRLDDCGIAGDTDRITAEGLEVVELPDHRGVGRNVAQTTR